MTQDEFDDLVPEGGPDQEFEDWVAETFNDALGG